MKVFPKVLRNAYILMFLLAECFAAPSSSPISPRDTVQQIVQKLSEKTQTFKTIRLDFTIQIERDEGTIKKIKAKVQSANPTLKSSTPVATPKSEGGAYPAREYLWYLKGEKLRLERKGTQNDKPKLLGVYDGEKYFIFFYYEDIVVEGQESAFPSRFKPGDVVQVHLYSQPMPVSDPYIDMYLPIQYLGLGVNNERWDKLLSKYEVSLVGEEKMGKTNCFVIELNKEEEIPKVSGGKMSYRERWRLWVDPEAGWSVRRVTGYTPDGRTDYILELSEYKGYPDNIWLPAKVTSMLFSYDEETKKNIPIVKKHS